MRLAVGHDGVLASHLGTKLWIRLVRNYKIVDVVTMRDYLQCWRNQGTAFDLHFSLLIVCWKVPTFCPY